MRRFIASALFASAVALVSSPSYAACSGASLEQEFREADLVVRARLVSEIEAWDDEPSEAFTSQWGDASTIYVLYGLRVVEAYKGKPSGRLHVFQERNSGAFYVDMDKDYLLFLKAQPSGRYASQAARGALYVPYACGQSKPISDVKSATLTELRRLAAQR